MRPLSAMILAAAAVARLRLHIVIERADSGTRQGRHLGGVPGIPAGGRIET
ncbi:hypothetical protein [Ancylobacter terrae]|uniref:hypothetical protein n=1 Tax=Ancylobacter sp. sgz301288 TaxID=3342077 RepID=UPI00385A6589